MVNRKERIKMYMGKIIYGVLLLLVVGAGRLCAGQNEWENPEKYEWNKKVHIRSSCGMTMNWER